MEEALDTYQSAYRLAVANPKTAASRYKINLHLKLCINNIGISINQGTEINKLPLSFRLVCLIFGTRTPRSLVTSTSWPPSTTAAYEEHGIIW